MDLCDKLGTKTIAGGFKIDVCTSTKKGHPQAVDIPINESNSTKTYENNFCRTCNYKSCPFYKK